MHILQRSTLQLCLVAAHLLLYCCGGSRIDAHTGSYAVRIIGGRSIADAVAKRNGFKNVGTIGNLQDIYWFKQATVREQRDTEEASGGAGTRRRRLIEQRLQSDKHVDYVIEETVQQRAKRLIYLAPSDPLWDRQWSLLNDDQGELDLNVEPAWIQGLTGRGVTVAVADDGLWHSHPDLSTNFRSILSWDFIGNDNDVMPRRDRDNHGTSCAGVIAMSRSNNICGTGIAYESHIAGLRMLEGDDTTDAIEASALGFKNQDIDVYSSSWGPYDNGFTIGGPGPILSHVLQRGAEEGRGGRGVIYVWASGNGGGNGDSCAMDGYVSSIYTIAVGTVDQNGVQAEFDEDCSGKLAVTVNHNSINSNNLVVTTDNRNRCRGNFRGTSASAPLLAGVIALVLQANNNLTWRDVQYLVVHTSRHGNLTTPRHPQPWSTNGAGLKFSHSFGFGAIDAEAMVTRARHWTNVPPQLKTTIFPHIGSGIAAVNGPLSVEFSVDRDRTEIRSLEHVVVKLSLTIMNYTTPWSMAQYHIMQSLLQHHFTEADVNNLLHHRGARRGDIEISLISPSGTRSTLLPRRRRDFVNTGTLSWSFSTVFNWGENPIGEWTLIVNFNSSEGHLRVSDVNVTLYGMLNLSVESVSQECSSECESAEKCAGLGPHYCDVCRAYRYAGNLTCTNSCSQFEHVVHGKYCLPLPKMNTTKHGSTINYVTPSSTSIITRIHSSYNDNTPAPTKSLIHHTIQQTQSPYVDLKDLYPSDQQTDVNKTLLYTPTATSMQNSATKLWNDVTMTSSKLQVTRELPYPTPPTIITPSTNKDPRPIESYTQQETYGHRNSATVYHCSIFTFSINFLVTCFFIIVRTH